MRFGIIALAALAYGASAACAASSTDGGSLEALLDRIADQHDGHDVASSSPASYAGESANAPSLQANASIPTNKVIRRSRSKKNSAEAKRWVWATAVIQDDSPNAPPVGQNVNQLGGAPTPITTPAANLPAPSFLPEAQIAAYLNGTVLNGTALHGNASSSLAASNSSTLSSTVPAAQTTPSPVRRTWAKAFGQPKADDHRRWIWATSVIQDGATDVPPPGSNANLLSNGAPATTPAATLVSPTFPPEPATTTSQSSDEQTQPTEVPTSAPVAVDATSPTSNESSTSTTSTAAAPESTPVAMLFDLFRKIAAGFEELLQEHASSSAAAESSAAATPVDKRWIWATSVIQEGATGVPPPGENANLLTTPAIPVTTPPVKLVSPSFPPVAASSSMTTSPPAQVVSPSSPVVKPVASSSASSAPPARGAFNPEVFQVIAAVPPAVVSSKSTTTTSSSSSPAASPTRRNNWLAHQDLLLASASSASAAARQTGAGQVYRHKKRMIRARRH
ncbi:hypothetical protein JCM8115_001338 [Rhodotorula mucilaginosa]|nr:hypothetical protein B0A53_03620 [Rhodotorula sp. CCFEE 5036]